jgi:enoyl-CoA hydratase/carnithine racemase
MDQADGVRIGIVNRIGWIEFNRPPVNAIDWTMLAAIHDRLAAALADPQIRVAVLASALPAYFSAGADLQAFKDIAGHDMRRWVESCHRIVRLLRESPKPVLAAINGTAVGGGLEMTLHCDLRFAAADARLGQPEIAIGFIPPVGATQALARLLGRPRAIRYLYDGQMVDAPTALQWGLVDELVTPEQLRPHVQAYAEQLAGKSATALAAIRRSITLGGGMSFDEGLALELETATALADTPDFRNGVTAFLARRAGKRG